jgi:molybdopterin converting factor subunit 1
MTVLFFAQSRQLAGCDRHFLRVEKPLTASEFWTLLEEVFPSLVSLQKTARLARNETYLEEGDRLQPDDEIAIIPPVSGG